MGFSPRNGEVILKAVKPALKTAREGFSPRNGEVILKAIVEQLGIKELPVSVPAMGK